MTFSPEHIENIRESKKGDKNPNFGKERTPEAKENIRKSLKGIQIWLGKSHTEKTKQKMRAKALERFKNKSKNEI